MRIIKNLFLFVLLIAVIILSFWLSFMVGKNLLTPVKKIPTSDLVTMEAGAFHDIGKITFEVEGITLEAKPSAHGGQQPKSLPVIKKVAENYKVQSGLFSSKANAFALQEKLKENGFPAKLGYYGKYFRVYAPAQTLAQANKLASNMKAKGFEAIVRRK